MDTSFVDIAMQRLFIVSLFFLGLALAVFLTIGFVYLMIIYIRLKKRENMALEMTTIEIMLPKENEIKIDAAEQMFASFSSLKKSHGWFSFMEVDDVLAFEIVGKKSEIRFYVSAPNKIVDLVEKTIYGYYPQADIKKVDEPNIFSENGNVAYAAMKHESREAYMPLKTYKEIPSDSLASLTSALSKMDDEEGAMIQILIKASDSKLKKAGKSYIKDTKKNEADPTKAKFETDQRTLERIGEKVSKPWFETMIRIVVSAKNQDTADAILRNIKNGFGQFDGESNHLSEAKIWFKGGFMMNFIYKFFPVYQLPWAKLTSELSSDELASMFHFRIKQSRLPIYNGSKRAVRLCLPKFRLPAAHF